MIFLFIYVMMWAVFLIYEIVRDKNLFIHPILPMLESAEKCIEDQLNFSKELGNYHVASLKIARMRIVSEKEAGGLRISWLAGKSAPRSIIGLLTLVSGSIILASKIDIYTMGFSSLVGLLSLGIGIANLLVSRADLPLNYYCLAFDSAIQTKAAMNAKLS